MWCSADHLTNCYELCGLLHALQPWQGSLLGGDRIPLTYRTFLQRVPSHYGSTDVHMEDKASLSHLSCWVELCAQHFLETFLVRRVSELTKLEVGIVSRETTTNHPLSWRRCNWKWSLPENTGDPLGLFGRVFMNYRVRSNISLLPSLRTATNITSIILTEFWLMFGG